MTIDSKIVEEAAHFGDVSLKTCVEDQGGSGDLPFTAISFGLK